MLRFLVLAICAITVLTHPDFSFAQGYNVLAAGSYSSVQIESIIQSGISHNCVLQGEQVQCWGQSAKGQTSVPPLTNPRAISMPEPMSPVPSMTMA